MFKINKYSDDGGFSFFFVVSTKRKEFWREEFVGTLPECLEWIATARK